MVFCGRITSALFAAQLPLLFLFQVILGRYLVYHALYLGGEFRILAVIGLRGKVDAVFI